MTDPIADNYVDIPTPEQPKKSTVTKRDVAAILAEFEPAAAPQKSALEKEREKRVERAQAIIRDAASRLQQNGVADGTPSEALAAFKALQTAAKRAINSINSLTARQLEIAEDAAPAKAPRTKRTSVPKPEAAPSAVAEDQAAHAAQYADEPSAEEWGTDSARYASKVMGEFPTTAEEEDGEAPVAPLKAQRAGRSGPSAPASSDPRGDADPNLGDGF